MKDVPIAETSTAKKIDPRIKLIAAKIRKENYKPDALIEILHTAQNAYGHLPMDVLKYITKELHLPPSPPCSGAAGGGTR